MNFTTAVPVLLGAVILATPAIAPAHSVGDAEALALKLSDALLPAPGTITTIDQHLQGIRGVEPMLGAIQCYPPWIPGRLLVRLTPSAWAEHVAGTYTGLDSLNAVYGPVETVDEYEHLAMLGLTFTAHYQPELLGAIYETAPGVFSADASVTGPTETDIEATDVGTYTFRYGWGNCPAGCAFNHYWTYQIGGGGVPVLIDEWGDALVGVDSPVTSPTTSWLNVFPNPFETATRITVSLPDAARIDVVDVTGRVVRTLEPSDASGGTVWNGRGDRGERLAAGVYLVTVRGAEGGTLHRKVVLRR